MTSTITLSRVNNIVVDIMTRSGSLKRSAVRPIHTDGDGLWAVRNKGRLVKAQVIADDRVRIVAGDYVTDESQFRPARNTDIGKESPSARERTTDLPDNAARKMGLFKAQVTRRTNGAKVKDSTLIGMRDAALEEGVPQEMLDAIWTPPSAKEQKAAKARDAKATKALRDLGYTDEQIARITA